MPKGDGGTPPSLGFFTVLEHEQLGLTGGYLLLNASGRPLEFHCTAPVKPNRAQQILFGPTLLPYLYGEQIGQTLLSKSSASPLLVCTDSPLAFAVREHVSLPIALVLSPESPRAQSAAVDPAAPLAAGQKWRVDAGHAHAGLNLFHWGRNQLAVDGDRQADRDLIESRLGALEPLDLAEPFARIREAIEEAQKGSRA